MENSDKNLIVEANKILSARPGLKSTNILIRHGPKLNHNQYTIQEKEHLENCIEKFKDSLTLKVRKLCNLGRAEWVSERGLAFVTKSSKFLQTMGHSVENGQIALFPEEALYLLDVGDIELLFQNVPLSFQDALILLLNENTSEYRCTLAEYQVFAYLVKLGFVLQRLHFYNQNVKIIGPSKDDFLKNTMQNRTKEINTENINFTKTNQFAKGNCRESRGWWLPQPKNDLNYAGNIVKPDRQTTCVESKFDIYSTPDINLLPPNTQINRSNFNKNQSSSINKKENSDIKDKDTDILKYSYTRKIDMTQVKCGIQDWKTYKQKIILYQNESNKKFEKLCQEMHSMTIKPVLSPTDAFTFGNLCKRIQLSEQTQHLPQNLILRNDSEVTINFNLYQVSGNKFKKTSPGKPHSRLVVTNVLSDLPIIRTQMFLQNLSGDIPVLYAVVDSDQIAFYSINNFGIPNLSKHNAN